MVDRIVFTKTLNEEEFSIVTSKFDNPEYYKEVPIGDSFYSIIKFKIANLNCEIKPDSLGINHLKVSGSIHRYFKGNNYDDFSYTHLCQAIDKLKSEFEIEIEDAKITKLEFSLNLKMAKECSHYYEMIKSYKLTNLAVFMNPLTGTSKLLGKRISLCDRNIKFYDKTEYTIKSEKIKRLSSHIIPERLLRIEIEFNSRRFKWCEGCFKLSFLKIKRVLRKYFEEFKGILNNIDYVEYFKIPDTLNFNQFLIAILINTGIDFDFVMSELKGATKYRKRKFKDSYTEMKELIPLESKEKQYELLSKVDLKFYELLRS